MHVHCTATAHDLMFRVAASVVLRQVAVDGMNPAPEVVENMASVVEQAGHRHGDDDPAEFLFRVDCLGAAPERLDF